MKKMTTLAAIAAVGLIAVVFGRVVTGGDADARVALQMPHRVGKGRGGHQLGI